MSTLVPYINFADRGREMLDFYKSVFGGAANITLVKDGPNASQMPPNWAERIFHADFKAPGVRILGSDIISDQAGRVAGNVYSLALMCDSKDEIKTLFDKLADGGKVVWPLKQAEWGGLFGQLVDKFDIQWMLDYEQTSGAGRDA